MYGFSSLANSSPQLFADSKVLSSDLAGDFFVRATAQRFAQFRAVGSGNVRVGINYRLFSELGSDLGEQATGHSLGYVQIDDLTTPIRSNRHVPQIGSTVMNRDSFSASQEGWMFAELHFNDGDMGAFQIWAQSAYAASSPIRAPEPSTFILLATGLSVCLVLRIRGFQRRGDKT
jgi:hypothetical protein